MSRARRDRRAVALAELDRTMSERFNATFARVAEEFTDSCTDLFGGGSARLVLGEAQGDGVAGVEIIAQPPGKKLQSLSLLSGGERALTAAALLFAILRVNPSPFCVLDEVDAALDESNVVRFCEMLEAPVRQDAIRGDHAQPHDHRRREYALRHHDGHRCGYRGPCRCGSPMGQCRARRAKKPAAVPSSRYYANMVSGRMDDAVREEDAPRGRPRPTLPLLEP